MNAARPHSIVVFPFLKTTAAVTLGGLTFRPSLNTEGASADEASDVARISKMLYLKDDLLIGSASYAVALGLDLGRPSDLEHLRDIQAFVAYCYASPRHEFGDLFLSSEHASLLIFAPGDVPLALVRPDYNVITTEAEALQADSRGHVPGYQGLYNFRHHFWVAHGSRVYGPKPHMTLNISQNLAVDLDSASSARPDYHLLRKLLERRAGDTKTRVFSAVRSFNAANDEANEEPTAIVHLAVAFEALLRVPADQKTDRLVDAISMLLGRIPRLDIWARQFYKARSRILHEGSTDDLRFQATDAVGSKAGQLYQSLLSYGRRVFQLCLGAVLIGADLAERANLSETLVTNQERFESICKVLRECADKPSEALTQIAPIVRSASQYRYVNEPGLRVESMIAAAKLMGKAFLEMPVEMTPDIIQSLRDFVETKPSPKHLVELKALKSVNSHLERWSTSGGPETAGIELMRLVWQYLGLHYEWMVRAENVKPGET
jgi:hypothetical protein